MKTFVLACLFVAVASAASLPAAHRRLHRRDVSELVSEPSYNYLPPSEAFVIAASTTPQDEVTEAITEAPTTAAPEESAVPEESSAILGDAGYEYRTVRRLKYRLRSRRDVSHLNLHYLPPTNEYLPPVAPEAPVEAAPEEAAPSDAEEVVVAAAKPEQKPSNEYLPPALRSADVAEDEPQPETEESVVVEAAVSEEPEAPQEAEAEPEVVDQVPEEVPEEVPVEAEAEPEAAAPAQEDVEEEQPAPVAEEESQDTAILAEDGYHYKQPEEVPPQLRMAVDESAPAAAAPEYLPPVDGEGVIVEGPGEETAVLADDGYHYRAVKRFRF